MKLKLGYELVTIQWSLWVTKIASKQNWMLRQHNY